MDRLAEGLSGCVGVLIILALICAIPLCIHDAMVSWGILYGILVCLVVLLLILLFCVYSIIKYICIKRIVTKVHSLLRKEISKYDSHRIINKRSPSWEPRYGWDGTRWNWYILCSSANVVVGSKRRWLRIAFTNEWKTEQTNSHMVIFI